VLCCYVLAVYRNLSRDQGVKIEDGCDLSTTEAEYFHAYKSIYEA